MAERWKRSQIEQETIDILHTLICSVTISLSPKDGNEVSLARDCDVRVPVKHDEQQRRARPICSNDEEGRLSLLANPVVSSHLRPKPAVSIGNTTRYKDHARHFGDRGPWRGLGMTLGNLGHPMLAYKE
jgi:hypothetical protein